MKTKWRSLRDAYVKDLRQGQQEQRSGSGASKRTVYCYSTLLGFLKSSVEPRETEDSFREEPSNQPTEQQDISSEELYDEEVLDPTYRPERSDSRRSSGSLFCMEDSVAEPQEVEGEEERAGPSTDQEPIVIEEPPQPERRSTPTQRQSRGPERARRRIPPGPVPTRRETEAEMSGAVSGLLGLLGSHQDLIRRELTDGDRGNLIKEYREHNASLKQELAVAHQHYSDEVRQIHDQYRSQIEQIQNHHKQTIGLLHQQMQQMQQQMQQLQQQNLDFIRQMSYPGYHTLLHFLENVPSSRMLACHSSLLETVKSHMQPRSVTPTLPQWSSASQAYQGYRGTSFSQIPSGGSSSPETPEFTTGSNLYSSEGK